MNYSHPIPFSKYNEKLVKKNSKKTFYLFFKKLVNILFFKYNIIFFLNLDGEILSLNNKIQFTFFNTNFVFKNN